MAGKMLKLTTVNKALTLKWDDPADRFRVGKEAGKLQKPAPLFSGFQRLALVGSEDVIAALAADHAVTVGAAGTG